MRIFILAQKAILAVLMVFSPIFAQNFPVVTNVDFNMRNDGSKKVDITYDVFSTQAQTVTVTIAASSDGGVTWNLPITQVTGAVGTGITNGTNKTIVWNAGAEIPNFYSATVQIRITADDGIVPFICGTGTVTYAGKTYTTVQIGTQCWLKENMDVGTMIQGSQNQSNNSIIEKYCYSNNAANCNIYGGLYQWNEAMQYVTTPGVQGICPPGWHIPTLAELQALGAAVGNNSNALKAIGQGSGVGTGSNTSGFSALLAGYRNSGGYFSELDVSADLWSSTVLNASSAFILFLDYNDSDVGLFGHSKSNGISVRCLKD